MLQGRTEKTVGDVDVNVGEVILFYVISPGVTVTIVL